LTELLAFYNKKYGKLASNFIHIQKSLVFFDDAESDAMPRMLKKVEWEEVKQYFENEVKKLSTQIEVFLTETTEVTIER